MWWRKQEQSGDPLADIVSRLHIPHPFDLDAFCEAIAADRGRPLFIAQLTDLDPDLPCGMWFGSGQGDYVFFKPTASRILQVQIILHEIAHMLLRHRGPHFDTEGIPSGEDVQVAAETMASLIEGSTQSFGNHTPGMPAADIMRAEAARIRAAASAPTTLDEDMGISPATMLSLLGRTKYSGPQETDAENLATLIHEKASRTEARSRTNDGTDVLERLSDAFGHPTQ